MAMKALEFRKSVARYLVVRGVGRVWPGVASSWAGPLHLVTRSAPSLPGSSWVAVRPLLAGICGSDLAAVACTGSPYFSAVTSFPFVPGHEVVGEVADVGPAVSGFARGDRVVVEPTLGCRAREVSPLCAPCAAGADGNCLNLTRGPLAPGILTGYCRDTGGGWGDRLVAHASQLHHVPAELSDEDAVLVEPFACAIHAVLAAGLEDGDRVLVLGAGSIGLLTLLALKRLVPGCRVIVAAKHRHQADVAKAWGADDVTSAGDRLEGSVIDRTGALKLKADLGPPMVLGGVDASFDCVASSRSFNQAVRLTRARGSVVVMGVPGMLDAVHGAPLVFQETRVVGAYGYGLESYAGRPVRTFELALKEAARKPGTLAELVTGLFPLVEYKEAMRTARATGPTRSLKSVFDLR